MDLKRVLAELRLELQRLDAAILSMERLTEKGKRRGRPPKLLADLRNTQPEEGHGVQAEGRRKRDGSSHNRIKRSAIGQRDAP